MKVSRAKKNRRAAFMRDILEANKPPCGNCGLPGAHYAPPSMGEDGFFTCVRKPGVSVGMELIRGERARQIAKGYTPQNDDKYKPGELYRAGKMYYEVGRVQVQIIARRKHIPSIEMSMWPWNLTSFHPKDKPQSNFLIAGALYLAQQEYHERRGNKKEVREIQQYIDFIAGLINTGLQTPVLPVSQQDLPPHNS